MVPNLSEVLDESRSEPKDGTLHLPNDNRGFLTGGLRTDTPPLIFEVPLLLLRLVRDLSYHKNFANKQKWEGHKIFKKKTSSK